MTRPSLRARRAVAVLAVVGLWPAVPVAHAADPDTTTAVVDDFAKDGAWYVSGGSAALATVDDALRIDYDVSGGSVGVLVARAPQPLPGLPRRVELDVLGDRSWNVLYLQLRDATGELFHYRLGNLDFEGWETLSIDPGATAPATTLDGDKDGVLDLPVQPHKIVIDKNGSDPDSVIRVDDLTVTYDDWSPLRPDTAVIVPSAGQATTLRMALQGSAEVDATLVDGSGRTRAWAPTLEGSGASASFRWDGKAGDGATMRGSVRGRLDIAWAEATHRYDVPYLAGVAARPAAKPGSIAGINSTMTTIGTADRAKVEHEATLMEDAYLRLARESFDWNRLEPRKGWYDWAKFDQAVEIARAHGIELVGTLGLSAKWASSAPSGSTSYAYYPPSSPADFAAYARAVVHRYKDRVKVWEIWNEENSDVFWKPSPSASAYAKLLKAAYAAIKAEDPKATVLLGGTVGFDQPFMDGLRAADAWTSFDALAIHTYVGPQPESSMIETWLGRARAYLAKHGTKPLWVTEFGWSTYSGSGSSYIGVSESRQAEYLARSYLVAARHGVRGMLAYSLLEYGTSTTSKLDNYGLVETGGRKKPAYAAVRRVAEALDGGTYAGIAAPNRASRTTISSMDATSGYRVVPLSGGSATLGTTTTRHGGSAALKVTYGFTSTSKGFELVRNLAVPGSPTTVSVWVHGDGSANPVYLKIADKTGETFQASIGSLQGGWQRLTMYMDGADMNWAHSGGDADGVIDYPITVRSLFVFRGGIGQLAGSAIFDDLQVESGPRVRGVVLSRRGAISAALYTLGPKTTATVPVSSTKAYLVDGPSATSLTVTSGAVSVGLSALPVNVLSSPVAASPIRNASGTIDRTALRWVAGDRVTYTLQVYSSRGALLRTIAAKAQVGAGIAEGVWDGRIGGVAASPGTYLLRATLHGPDGRASTLTREIVVE